MRSLFIEFPPLLLKNTTMFEVIEIAAARYRLRDVVRCNNNHFTCAVDDLCVNILEFPSFSSLRQVYREGRFFAIYELKELVWWSVGAKQTCRMHIYNMCQ